MAKEDVISDIGQGDLPAEALQGAAPIDAASPEPAAAPGAPEAPPKPEVEPATETGGWDGITEPDEGAFDGLPPGEPEPEAVDAADEPEADAAETDSETETTPPAEVAAAEPTAPDIWEGRYQHQLDLNRRLYALLEQQAQRSAQPQNSPGAGNTSPAANANAAGLNPQGSAPQASAPPSRESIAAEYGLTVEDPIVIRAHNQEVRLWEQERIGRQVSLDRQQYEYEQQLWANYRDQFLADAQRLPVAERQMAYEHYQEVRGMIGTRALNWDDAWLLFKQDQARAGNGKPPATGRSPAEEARRKQRNAAANVAAGRPSNRKVAAPVPANLRQAMREEGARLGYTL